MEVFLIEIYQKFFHQFLQLYRPFELHLNIELSKHDLYRGQWTILHYLANNGSATLVELAHYQSVEKPTITRTISRLEELGYIEHVPGKDKREKRMQLTGYGRKTFEEVRLTVDRFEQRILAGIPEKEQLETIRIMEEIRSNLTN